jgi:hypothetical protein
MNNGDIIRYNGDITNAFDTCTLELMKESLEKGMIYKIVNTGFYQHNSSKPYCMIYYIRDLNRIKMKRSIYGIFYPTRSFSIVHSIREFYTSRYNLK